MSQWDLRPARRVVVVRPDGPDGGRARVLRRGAVGRLLCAGLVLAATFVVPPAPVEAASFQYTIPAGAPAVGNSKHTVYFSTDPGGTFSIIVDFSAVTLGTGTLSIGFQCINPSVFSQSVAATSSGAQQLTIGTTTISSSCNSGFGFAAVSGNATATVTAGTLTYNQPAGSVSTPQPQPTATPVPVVTPAPSGAVTLGDWSTDSVCQHGNRTDGTELDIATITCVWQADGYFDSRHAVGVTKGALNGPLWSDWRVGGRVVDAEHNHGIMAGVSPSWLLAPYVALPHHSSNVAPEPTTGPFVTPGPTPTPSPTGAPDPFAAGVAAVAPFVTVCNQGYTDPSWSASVNISWYDANGSRMMTSAQSLVFEAETCPTISTGPFKAPVGAWFAQVFVSFDGLPGFVDADHFGSFSGAGIRLYAAQPTGTLDQTSSCFLPDGTIRPSCSGIPTNPDAGCDTAGPISGDPKVVICQMAVPTCTPGGSGLDVVGWLSFISCWLTNDMVPLLYNALTGFVNVFIDLIEPGPSLGQGWTEINVLVSSRAPATWIAATSAALDSALSPGSQSDTGLPSSVTVLGTTVAVPWSTISDAAAPYRSWMAPLPYIGLAVFLLREALSFFGRRSAADEQLSIWNGLS